MRVVQMGCGITGRVCAEHVVKNNKVSELILADARIDAAQNMIDRLKNDKLTIAKVDANDKAAVRKILRGCDLLISAVPSEYVKEVFEQALKAGCDYVDFSVTQEALHEFEKVSKICEDAGITAITGMGSDCGISDIFARYAANKLDAAYEARTMDGDNASAEGLDFFTLWSPIDMLEEVTTPAAIFRNGKISYLPPLFERQIYNFPEPIGPLPVYNTTHEETFFMPKFINGIKNADFRIAIDDNFAQIANMLMKIGLHSLKPVEVKGVKIRPLDIVASLMPRPVDLTGNLRGHAGVIVEVTGEKGGRKTMVKVWTILSHEKAYEMSRTNATGYLVGTGGAVGADLILSGSVKGKHLYAPEMLPAEECVAMLPKKGLEVKEEFSYL